MTEPLMPDPTGEWQWLVQRFITMYTDELTDEFGAFSTEPVPGSERVLIKPANAPTVREGWQVAYLSDHTAAARLVVDDYIPEYAGESDAGS